MTKKVHFVTESQFCEKFWSQNLSPDIVLTYGI